MLFARTLTLLSELRGPGKERLIPNLLSSDEIDRQTPWQDAALKLPHLLIQWYFPLGPASTLMVRSR